jgi:hypothetical protein
MDNEFWFKSSVTFVVFFIFAEHFVAALKFIFSKFKEEYNFTQFDLEREQSVLKMLINTKKDMLYRL